MRADLVFNPLFPAEVIVFAVIFAVNSSIHSFLVVNYAAADKVAVSVGLYYMSNAMGRLTGTIGSGILYTYVGAYIGPLAGTDAVAGMAACFLAGTICSFLAVVITSRIDDHHAGLKCGPCLTIVAAQDESEEKGEEEIGEEELTETERDRILSKSELSEQIMEA